MNKEQLMQHIEEAIDCNQLNNMQTDFYKTISNNNIELSKLPRNHPLNVMSTMFLIAETGETEQAWRYFITLLIGALSEECEK